MYNGLVPCSSGAATALSHEQTWTPRNKGRQRERETVRERLAHVANDPPARGRPHRIKRGERWGEDRKMEKQKEK